MYKALAVLSSDEERRGDPLQLTSNKFASYDQKYKIGDYLSTLGRYKSHYIVSDIATNWAQEIDSHAHFYLYKFFPHIDSTYNYVAECSNRGICNDFEGICECFSGYSGDSCKVQQDIAM